MGQGAEDAGFYEMEYNPYDYEESHGYTVWTGRDGVTYNVSDMSERHLKNSIKIVGRLAAAATFSCEEDEWNDWIDVFEEQLYTLQRNSLKKDIEKRKETKTTEKTVQRGAKVDLVCWCGKQYSARKADLKRGWAKSCCKSHAAIKRDYGRPDPKTLEGKNYKEALK